MFVTAAKIAISIITITTFAFITNSLVLYEANFAKTEIVGDLKKIWACD